MALVCQKLSVRYQGRARVKARAKELDNIREACSKIIPSVPARIKKKFLVGGGGVVCLNIVSALGPGLSKVKC